MPFQMSKFDYTAIYWTIPELLDTQKGWYNKNMKGCAQHAEERIYSRIQERNYTIDY